MDEQVSETGSLLRTGALSVRYGGHLAVSDVDLEVRAGELVGLIGANGAGKTTLLDAISGFVHHSGTVTFAGRDLSSAPPHQRARAGMSRTWQGVDLFGDLTVRQNCEVAVRRAGPAALVGDLFGRRRSTGNAVDEILEIVGLAGRGDDLPTSLSNGQQKMAGVARALAPRPELVLLDEPAAGLDEGESAVFGASLRHLIDTTGTAGLLVDHDTRLVFGVCDRIYVLDFGGVVASGSPAEVRADSRVIAAYLGSSTGGSAS